MKIKVKNKILNEARITKANPNIGGQDLGYTDIENVRIHIGTIIDRAILTPDDGDSLDNENETQMTQLDYVNRIRDIVKGGRKVPYLYYAYKGIDEDGNILSNNDVTPVLELQIKKAGELINRLQMSGDASVDAFVMDFGNIMTQHDEWDKRYEERIKDLLPSKVHQQMAMKKGYDRSAYQAGQEAGLRPFSTVAIGRGSKPVFAQNVDFMYKTSPEPNLKIDPADLWAFSIRVPLYLAYVSITGMDMPPRVPGKKLDRKAIYKERYNITPNKVANAYNHWSQNEEQYRYRYVQIMQQEPNSWTQYQETKTIADMVKLNFESFNKNYIESKRVARKKGNFDTPSYLDNLTPDMRTVLMLLQPAPLREELYETIMERLADPEMAKTMAKDILNKMIHDKNTSIKRNIGRNLQVLVQQYGERPEVKKNLTWIQQAIQQYYIMGGQ